jgi:hypothetical protein
MTAKEMYDWHATNAIEYLGCDPIWHPLFVICFRDIVMSIKDNPESTGSYCDTSQGRISLGRRDATKIIEQEALEAAQSKTTFTHPDSLGPDFRFKSLAPGWQPKPKKD